VARGEGRIPARDAPEDDAQRHLTRERKEYALRGDLLRLMNFIDPNEGIVLESQLIVARRKARYAPARDGPTDGIERRLPPVRA
jgi:hypothetical protein